jgi:single-strand DNA-binding protein
MPLLKGECMSLQNVPILGRLAADPTLMFSNAGMPIAHFTVVTSGRKKDQATGEWSDTDTSFWKCTAFGPLAENICETLVKGQAVLGHGNASQDDWEDKEGKQRTSLKFIVNNLGLDLRWVKRGDRQEAFQEAPPF